jgi:hypothetical protein
MLPQSSVGPLKWPERGCYDPGDTYLPGYWTLAPFSNNSRANGTLSKAATTIRGVGSKYYSCPTSPVRAGLLKAGRRTSTSAPSSRKNSRPARLLFLIRCVSTRWVLTSCSPASDGHEPARINPPGSTRAGSARGGGGSGLCPSFGSDRAVRCLPHFKLAHSGNTIHHAVYLSNKINRTISGY